MTLGLLIMTSRAQVGGVVPELKAAHCLCSGGPDALQVAALCWALRRQRGAEVLLQPQACLVEEADTEEIRCLYPPPGDRSQPSPLPQPLSGERAPAGPGPGSQTKEDRETQGICDRDSGRSLGRWKPYCLNWGRGTGWLGFAKVRETERVSSGRQLRSV